MREVIIIGSGPAGYTAGIYAARAGLDPLLIASSVAPGGDLMTTTEVDNFPGFPTGIQGPELMANLQEQAERFGAEVLHEDVTNLDLSGPIKTVTLGNGDVHKAHTIIFATGSAYRKLGLPNEEHLSGRGLSWCATCDGFFFKNKVVAVIGGGDSAMEEALFLSRFASKVFLVHRGRTPRASQVMLTRAHAEPKIEFLPNLTVDALLGEDQVTGVDLIGPNNSGHHTLHLDGVFVAIGADPRTHLIHGQVNLTPAGTIAVDGRSSRTNVAGVFAAGDVIDPTYRQAVTAAASGTVAALDAQHYLAAQYNA